MRRAAERALRAGVLATLAVLAWRADGRVAPPARDAVRAPDAVAARAALARWSTTPRADTLHLALAAPPTPRERAWLRALGAAGAATAWSADSAPPLAIVLEPEPVPAGGVRVRVAAPAGARLALGDGAGALGELRPAGAGGVALVPAVAGAVRAGGRGGARATLADSVAPRRVLVLGRAGWETKFVIAALEEAGWAVDARAPVSPGVVVRQGAAAAPDTATHSAVVVLDSTGARDAARIARFVRQGGGLVLAGEAAPLAAFASLAPGAAAAAREGGVAGALATDEPRRGLALHAVARLRADAVALERRGALVAAAARRVGAGRVLQLGYEETWRWRMLGTDAAPEAHRDWWSRVVGSVAYAPVIARGTEAARPAADTLPDDAPLARAVAALGPPAPAGDAAPARARRGLPWWLFPLLAAALLAEWASRRFRGAR